MYKVGVIAWSMPDPTVKVRNPSHYRRMQRVEFAEMCVDGLGAGLLPPAPIGTFRIGARTGTVMIANLVD